ncbi:hypothetical protein [Paenibacillus cremeus]|uniref:Uncharacterized protein n=1 Tax=Paenibacillus cremeus TaxID=2163881 RepID=A0A559K4Q6_9BACL|nr:hypothetical protein [Paenibacillus cremeus]TVY07063.1 hypothetical protein FPZ49_25670 [Paenibacillus cremeus]
MDQVKVKQTLTIALNHWNAMSRASGDDAEESANAFEAAFYRFIDAVREWYDGLGSPPQTLEQLLELPLMKELTDELPAPLYLNFETEAELIVERQCRLDEDKYD